MTDLDHLAHALVPTADSELFAQVVAALERIAAEHRTRRALLEVAPRRSEARAQLERLAWYLSAAAEELSDFDTFTLELADPDSLVYTPAPERDVLASLCVVETSARPAAERRAAQWREHAADLRTRAAQVPADEGGRRTTYHDNLEPPTRALCSSVVELLDQVRPDLLAPLSCEAVALAESLLAHARGERDADTDLRRDMYRALEAYCRGRE